MQKIDKSQKNYENQIIYNLLFDWIGLPGKFFNPIDSEHYGSEVRTNQICTPLLRRFMYAKRTCIQSLLKNLRLVDLLQRKNYTRHIELDITV